MSQQRKQWQHVSILLECALCWLLSNGNQDNATSLQRRAVFGMLQKGVDCSLDTWLYSVMCVSVSRLSMWKLLFQGLYALSCGIIYQNWRCSGYQHIDLVFSRLSWIRTSRPPSLRHTYQVRTSVLNVPYNATKLNGALHHACP